MAWQQYQFSTTLADKDTIEDALVAAGAVAVTVQAANDEPIFELAPDDRPMWQSINLTALTDAELSTDDFLLQLNAILPQPITPSSKEFIADQDWTRAWMDRFEPICCGERLWIVPSWQTPPESSACNLILDPGLAFGSGTHPTTKMCLQWLDKNITGGETVLDYGCGSGVLAIAALLLGATQADGTDIDPQAITASYDNAERNGVDTQHFSASLCEDYNGTENDIVVANILAGPLAELKPVLLKALKVSGKLVLSGILEEQAEDLIASYSDMIDLKITGLSDGWVLLTGIK